MNTDPGKKKLSKIIEKQAEPVKDPAGRPVRVIRETDALKTARQAGTGLRQVYASALEAGIWPLRYLRNAESLSAADQLRLARCRVAVIGAGGLGANIFMLLARMGIGMLTIADPDVFEESNLNRQLLATAETLGTGKTEAAKKTLAAVNPAVEVRLFPVRLTPKNGADVLAEANVAADALDSVSDRLVLADACRQAGIPLVHAAIAGFEGQLMAVFPQDEGLERIYGDAGRAQKTGAAPEAVMGVPGVTPALLAALQAMEVVKILLDRGRILRNRMLYVDLSNAGFQEFAFGP